MSNDSEWPAHFPPCCPPEDATALSGEYFYLAHHPVTDEDLKCAKERGVFKKIDDCQRASLSFWNDPSPLTAILQLPLHQGKTVMKLDVDPEFGRGKQTNHPQHYSIWFFRRTHASLKDLLRVKEP